MPLRVFQADQPCRSNRIRRAALVACSSMALTLPSILHAQSPQLAAVFTQMDAASKRFQNATANVQRDNYERVVHDTTTEKGSIYLDRKGNGIEFGATVYPTDASGKPAAAPSRILSYRDGTLQMYTPATKQVDVFKSGGNQNKLEGYLALGFGANSQDLQRNWTITDAGPETLTDNGQQVKTEKLVLVSKDPGVQSTFKQITIWLDPARDISLKQVFDTPGGDRQTATYTNIRLNTKLNTTPYKIPTGKGISVIQH
jgi:outer membrane lipoprotein-sorting protein